ncbi:MAG: hypothetical protein KF773_35875 [Deltaproteobacteria bacterium]|nr:hypothetical protein [Deltaproteobacteria bacterium]MCW5808161.1 hypothetical protein [Deltaproteobacteria bacterium]
MKLAALSLASVLLATTGSAFADERRTHLHLGGMIGARGDFDPMAEKEPTLLGGPRLTLGWENPMLEYPELPGVRAAFELTPEVLLGASFEEGTRRDRRGGLRAEGMLGVGLRGELRLAQLRQGLMKLSMRGSIYVAARAFVIGEQRETLGEFAFGEYFLVSRTARIGFELHVQKRLRDAATADEREIGVLTQLYVGWTL